MEQFERYKSEGYTMDILKKDLGNPVNAAHAFAALRLGTSPNRVEGQIISK